MRNTKFAALLVVTLLASARDSAMAQRYFDVNNNTGGSGVTGGSTYTWSTGTANWSGEPVGNTGTVVWTNGSHAVFSTGTDATGVAFTANVPSAVTVSNLTVEEGTVSLTGAAVGVGTGKVTVKSGAILSVPSATNVTQTSGGNGVELDGGTLRNTNSTSGQDFWTGNANIALTANGGTINYTQAGLVSIIQSTTIISGASSTATLTKNGAGTIAIASVSTYAGGTTINNGTLQLMTGNNRLPTGTTVSFGQPNGNLGTLDLNGRNQQVAGLNSNTGTNATASNNTVTSTAAATLTLGGSGSYSYGDGTNANSGVITGAISLVKQGAGTQTLGDSGNSYTGTTTINGGTLKLGAAGVIPDGSAVTLANAPATNFDLDNNNETIASLAGGGGSGGNLQLGSGTLTTAGNANTTYDGVISGVNGKLVKQGNGVLTLGGANTYTGGTTVSGGTLEGNSTSLQGAILNNAAVSFNQGLGGTYAGNMSGTGSVTKAGAGTLTLTGTNSYGGATNVMAGTLLVNGSNTGSGAIVVGANATLGGTGSIGGAVTVNGTNASNLARLAPGASIESLNAATLSLGAFSEFDFEFDLSLNADRLNLTQTTGTTLSIAAGAALAISGPLSPIVPYGTVFTLISYRNGGWNGGTFFGLPDDSNFFYGSNKFRINYNDTVDGVNFNGEGLAGAQYVTLTAVPEAGAFVTMGLVMLCGMSAAWFSKRRRRNQIPGQL